MDSNFYLYFFIYFVSIILKMGLKSVRTINNSKIMLNSDFSMIFINKNKIQIKILLL